MEFRRALGSRLAFPPFRHLPFYFYASNRCGRGIFSEPTLFYASFSPPSFYLAATQVRSHLFGLFPANAILCPALVHIPKGMSSPSICKHLSWFFPFPISLLWSFLLASASVCLESVWVGPEVQLTPPKTAANGEAPLPSNANKFNAP